jgi:hypothetical protein
MPHRPRPSLLRLLTQAVLTTLAITTGGFLVVMGSAGMAEVPDRAGARPGVEVTVPAPTPETRLMRRYDCSTTGFAPDADPQSAIVRGAGGKVRAVSFEEGWAVHTAAEQSASGPVLVAVCLRPLR